MAKKKEPTQALSGLLDENKPASSFEMGEANKGTKIIAPFTMMLRTDIKKIIKREVNQLQETDAQASLSKVINEILAKHYKV